MEATMACFPHNDLGQLPESRSGVRCENWHRRGRRWTAPVRGQLPPASALPTPCVGSGRASDSGRACVLELARRLGDRLDCAGVGLEDLPGRAEDVASTLRRYVEAA